MHVLLVACLALLRKRVYHLTQHVQALVDVASLLQPLARSLGELLSLASSQVHEMEPALITHTPYTLTSKNGGSPLEFEQTLADSPTAL